MTGAFDDLEDAVAEQEEPEEETSKTTTDGEARTESEQETTQDPRSTPAFEFSSDLRRSIYTREQSWQSFEDGRDLEMTRVLRDHDVRDVTSREVHDAMVRLAAENPDELARLVLDSRGIDIDEE
ncbi:hypothetical protein [Halomicrococcus sp. SG-WS-1]|uniref:hypothetical protein n=1 Tax=Halomicrococcus sp. SG-WS-1 TaxID=3439057 RepID=UPI003F79B432